ncbi:hypothetical protein Pmani_029869 [Petrolisthes manimaculis]|uniref:ZAD domain-containing protein n=1 Tax=Petrolisthes manimaculis TaxID=1843537 RepID=A0AAE1NYN5_9EUCA|nr:hypothetical protein Pmani_029869 [Petrolisthes manimaculis]
MKKGEEYREEEMGEKEKEMEKKGEDVDIPRWNGTLLEQNKRLFPRRCWRRCRTNKAGTSQIKFYHTYLIQKGWSGTEQQLQQPIQHHIEAIPVTPMTPKINKTGGSATPHCLVCNVHLGMFAKGGMEVFSDKVTTTYGKVQVHNVIGSIINQEISIATVHSSIVCKKCFKLLDDIDTLEAQLVGMKQVISSKYTVTQALVKKGLVGKAVLEEAPKPQSPDKVFSTGKIIRTKGVGRRGRLGKLGRARKSGKLALKSGKLVVRGVEEHFSPKIELTEEIISSDEDDFSQDVQHEVIIGDTGFMRKPLILAHIKQHGELENLDAFVQSNSPTAGINTAGEASGSSVRTAGTSSSVRKKNLKRETTHTTVVHIPQSAQQEVHTTVEEIPHFIIPNNDNREGGNTGETVSYMFSTTFPTQGTVSHYTPINWGQL